MFINQRNAITRRGRGDKPVVFLRGYDPTLCRFIAQDHYLQCSATETVRDAINDDQRAA